MFAEKYFTTTSVLTCTLQNDLSVEFDTRRLPLGGREGGKPYQTKLFFKPHMFKGDLKI